MTLRNTVMEMQLMLRLIITPPPPSKELAPVNAELGKYFIQRTKKVQQCESHICIIV